jgi:N-acetylglucosaminyldiphosphoundecaprenol N-acetyl-beta-D-mannosaminyltransferase
MSSQPQLQANALFPRGRWERIAIGRALVERTSFQETIDCLTEHAVSGGAPALVITANAQHIVLLDREPGLRDIYQDADMVVADGYSLVFAARFLGQRLPGRVPGVDLFQALCGRAAEHGLRVFLLGGRPGSAEMAASVIRKRFPEFQATTYCPPYGFEHSEYEMARVTRCIQDFRPDLLFVAFGSPKQERWIYEHGLSLGAAVSIGIGGSFEMVAGVVPRAPRWMQNIGCEWLYRLLLEPRRMWRRYLIGNIEFAWIILRQLRGNGAHTLPPSVGITSVGDGYR